MNRNLFGRDDDRGFAGLAGCLAGIFAGEASMIADVVDLGRGRRDEARYREQQSGTFNQEREHY